MTQVARNFALATNQLFKRLKAERYERVVHTTQLSGLGLRHGVAIKGRAKLLMPEAVNDTLYDWANKRRQGLIPEDWGFVFQPSTNVKPIWHGDIGKKDGEDGESVAPTFKVAKTPVRQQPLHATLLAAVEFTEAEKKILKKCADNKMWRLKEEKRMIWNRSAEKGETKHLFSKPWDGPKATSLYCARCREDISPKSSSTHGRGKELSLEGRREARDTSGYTDWQHAHSSCLGKETKNYKVACKEGWTMVEIWNRVRWIRAHNKEAWGSEPMRHLYSEAPDKDMTVRCRRPGCDNPRSKWHANLRKPHSESACTGTREKDEPGSSASSSSSSAGTSNKKQRRRT